ncbi:MAG: flagellar biosynthesis regulator FlaF [Pseudomonadota bacterium]|nr:flagellar biosynthesis regulator FlaF [Pseudomonadota bacterium]
MPINSYVKTQDYSGNPRATEYRALALVTGRLIEAKERGGRTLIEALFANQNLWTLFQADLAGSGNGLPPSLKAQLLSLSIWVQRFSSKVMKGEASADSLIEVNKAIMDGLKPQTARPEVGHETNVTMRQPISATV